jgi:hypothetical protein
MNSGRENPIIGYEHPETLNTVSKIKKYKIFSHKNNKIFNDESSISIDENFYAISSSIVNENCPTCNSESNYICPCAYNDKKCQNNHVWYTNRAGETVNGNPHK